MTRKLHNTLMAMIASSCLLAVGIIAGSPVAPEMNAASSTSMYASIETQADIAADAIVQADAVPMPKVRAVQHRRQSLAMPFFSFAPRS